ncbi:uncharacterized protein G2W53_005082 [Senna tora]|uniref:Uncharacterized protein n=1 Tax=Senna tora TaxID=362788 RepID=A0A834XCW1_9FABA|nr:uncharacterized protein G2W53_005082 [Senna tora]
MTAMRSETTGGGVAMQFVVTEGFWTKVVRKITEVGTAVEGDLSGRGESQI